MTPSVKEFAEKHLKAISYYQRVINVGAKVVKGQEMVTPGIKAYCVDFEAGPNVDQVVNATDLIQTFGEQSWDHVCSFEMLEHCIDWQQSLLNLWGILKDGGLLVLTMAAPTKGYHGYPHDYVRMELEEMVKIFDGHYIVDVMRDRISIGVAVIKRGNITVPLAAIHTTAPQHK